MLTTDLNTAVALVQLFAGNFKFKIASTTSLTNLIFILLCRWSLHFLFVFRFRLIRNLARHCCWALVRVAFLGSGSSESLGSLLLMSIYDHG